MDVLFWAIIAALIGFAVYGATLPATSKKVLEAATPKSEGQR